MKSVGASLDAHFASETTSIAHLWKVTRTDGQVFGFTDHSADIPLSGVTYQAATGFTASAVATAAALNVDNLEVQGVFDAAAITEVDLLAGKWDFAQVQLQQVNWADTTQGVLKVRRGWLGEVRSAQGFSAELRGMMQKLQQAIGRVYAPGCDADLGDARCKVNLATFTDGTVTGTLTGVTSNRVFTDSARTQAANWFAGGKLTFTSGGNAGIAREVKAFASGGQITLHLPMPYTVQAGDAYRMTAGCDKTLATCVAKFANVVNFRGFPHVPGIDRMVSGK